MSDRRPSLADGLGIVQVPHGGMYFPWNYRSRTDGTGRIARRRHDGERGRHVFNALDGRGRVLGSADMQLGPRAASRIVESEEFEYGGGNGSRGPYLWPDDGAETYIIILRGLWTRPEARRRGIARMLVDSVADFGLPVYVAFGNPHMERWFESDLRPDDDWILGEWQAAVCVFEAYADELRPSAAPGGRYRWDLTCTATRRIASGELYAYEPPTLGDLLFSPVRATWSELDGGAGETDLTDTGFANDRRFGYELIVDRQTDPSLDYEIDGEPDDAAYERALSEKATLHSTGTLQVTDLDVLRDYAQFRRMLRTGVCDPPIPSTEAEAVHEILVAAQQQPFDDVLEFQIRVEPS